MNSYESVLLDTSPWRGKSPGGPCYKAGDDQFTSSLENKSFVGFIALPIRSLSH